MSVYKDNLSYKIPAGRAKCSLAGQNHETSRDALQLVLWHPREQAERGIDVSPHYCFLII